MVSQSVTKRKIVYNFTHVRYLELNSERQKVGKKKKETSGGPRVGRRGEMGRGEWGERREEFSRDSKGKGREG